jgi:hypothetical protein
MLASTAPRKPSARLGRFIKEALGSKLVRLGIKLGIMVH